jgi:hypothetical protein
VEWDIERFADKTKPVKVKKNHHLRIQEEIARMQKTFPIPEGLGSSEEPATVVDKYGRIFVWHLPDIFSESRVVSHHQM